MVRVTLSNVTLHCADSGSGSEKRTHRLALSTRPGCTTCTTLELLNSGTSQLWNISTLELLNSGTSQESRSGLSESCSTLEQHGYCCVEDFYAPCVNFHSLMQSIIN